MGVTGRHLVTGCLLDFKARGRVDGVQGSRDECDCQVASAYHLVLPLKDEREDALAAYGGLRSLRGSTR